MPTPKRKIIRDKSVKTKPSHYDWFGKSILIVEDVAINHMIIDRILRKTRANLYWAMDGQKAVEICQQESIDLVLMDLRLPVMNGYDATREIRKFRESLPIIAQTAYVLPEEKYKVLEVGCNDLITKPIISDVLLKTVSKYLDGEQNNSDN